MEPMPCRQAYLAGCFCGFCNPMHGRVCNRARQITIADLQHLTGHGPTIACLDVSGPKCVMPSRYAGGTL